jgi:hypothetical protein
MRRIVAISVLISMTACASQPRSVNFGSVALIAATAADVESTFRALKRCIACSEANPVMRPLVSAGRVPTYAFAIGIDVATIRLSMKMKKDKSPYWWLPIATGAVGHGLAAWSNGRQR